MLPARLNEVIRAGLTPVGRGCWVLPAQTNVRSDGSANNNMAAPGPG